MTEDGTMQTHKIETLTVRLTPEAKAMLRETAAHERRRLANMPELMIRDWAARAARLNADSDVLARDRYAGPADR